VSNGNILLRRRLIFATTTYQELTADSSAARKAFCPKHHVHRSDRCYSLLFQNITNDYALEKS
jgi:hypothetical protein